MDRDQEWRTPRQIAGVAWRVCLLLLVAGCRLQSVEHVGKAGKSLANYKPFLADTATLCEIQNGPEKCKSEAVRTVKVEAKDVGLTVYDTDELIDKSLSMLAEYGAALEALSGKKSAGASEFVEGALSLNGSTEWVELGAKGPDAIKAGAKILDKLIAGAVQKKVLASDYERLAEPMAELKELYRNVVEGQLKATCMVRRQIAENQAPLRNAELACPEGAMATCENSRQLALMSSNQLRAQLNARREALYAAAAGFAAFFASHETLGKLLRADMRDSDVLAAMKMNEKKAKASMKSALEKYEADQASCKPAEGG